MVGDGDGDDLMSLTATRDKDVYQPGDLITLTVTSDQRIKSTPLDIVAAGEDVKVTISVQTGVTLTDPTGRKWTVKSDDGYVQILTSPA
jgi:hypothetical protein